MEGQASLEGEQKQLWKEDNQADDNQDEASSFPLGTSESSLILRENDLNNVEEEIPEMVATVEEATSPSLENTTLGPGLDYASSAMTMPGRQPRMLEEPQVLDLSLKRQSPRGRLPHEAFMCQLVTMPGLQPTMSEEPQVLDLSLKRASTRGRLLHKASVPQPADRSEVKDGKISRASPEGVELRKESGCDGDGTQKRNQIGQTRDMLHRHQEGVIFEEEMGTMKNKRLNHLQSSDFAPSIPLRKSPVKCQTAHTDGKPRQTLQCGESSAWSPKDRRVHTGKKSDKSLKFEKCFSLGSEVSQPLIPEGKPYKSMESAESFKRTFEPEMHQRTHKGEKVYECGKGFKWKSHLMEHQRIHTGEKSFPCKKCGRTFSQKGNLGVHERIHKEEKSYMCSECGKTFNQRSKLVVHKRIHTGEKPYSCQVCEKHFSDPSSLRRHRKMHTGEKHIVCKVCGRTFSRHDYLVVHKRIHTGEKPYSCQVCGKRFSQRSTLGNHTRIHTGEKPFECNECGKRFNRRCNLVAHQRCHPREKPVSS